MFYSSVESLFITVDPFSISEDCQGCAHIDGEYCSVYVFPRSQHTRILGCAMRTHNKTVIEEEKRINPLKASKKTYKVVT